MKIAKAVLVGIQKSCYFKSVNFQPNRVKKPVFTQENVFLAVERTCRYSIERIWNAVIRKVRPNEN